MTGESTRSTRDPDVPKLDGFEDLTEIGRGGFSVVFSATQTAFGRRVAIKVLNLSGDEARRSEREARALGRLSDVPHVVQAHQVMTTEDGRPALVMSLMPGSLGRLLKQQGRVEPSHALRWLDQVARALDAAHAMGIHHRDVKPENVLLSGWGDAHLADFGIAGVDGLVASTTTEFAFSPPHAPPERLMGTETDLVAGDIYSLASTFFTILTGRTPFGTTSDGGVYGLTQRVVNDEVPCPPGMPPAAHAVFRRAMAKSASDRYRSAAEFASDLRTAYETPPPPPPLPGEELRPEGSGSDTGASRVVLDARMALEQSAADRPAPADPTRVRIPTAEASAEATEIPPAFPGPPPFEGTPASPAEEAVLPRPAPVPPSPAPEEGGEAAPAAPSTNGAPTGPADTSLAGATEGGKARRARRRVLAAVTAVLALAAIGVGVWAVTQNSAEPPSVPLAAGGTHTCSLASDGSASCWGADGGGQLGDGDIGAYAARPASVTDLGGMDELSLGNVHSCAIGADGEVRCWGRNNSGQLGDGTTQSSPRPVAVRGIGPAKGIATGREHTCALLTDGTVWCWGKNNQGQLGNNFLDESSNEPLPVEGVNDAMAIAAGNAFTCVIEQDRTVGCWGDNQFGQVGLDPASERIVPKPTKMPGINAARAITAGPGHVCVLDGEDIRCWGSNATGELGLDPSTRSSPTPVVVEGLTDVTQISAGGSLSGWAQESFSTVGHTCVLLKDRTVRCWGDNSLGQLGDGTGESSTTPVRTKDLKDVIAIAAGGGPKLDAEQRLIPHAHTCAQLADRTVRCWGDNSHGQLGDGTKTPSSEPVKVSD